MSFVSRPPAAEAEAELPLVNDGFFPDIDLAAARDEARITTAITGARLRTALIGAVLSVGIDLANFKASAIASGHASLADMPAPQIDGKSINVLRYLRAVHLYAKAELIERHRDFDTTTAGGSQADELGQSIGDLRRDALHAVRDIVGITRTTVDLI
jgi:hypothetical protein